MENYFIIGGSELQLDFIRTVQKNGYCAHVIDYNNDCVGASIADVFHCISIDDLDAILSLAIQYVPVAIHTVATEQGNVTACYVGEKLGLNCNSYQTSLNTTDKQKMKQVLADFNLATPLSIAVKALEELKQLDISYPVIVKASDRSAGRGVRLANNESELVSSFNEALDVSFNKVVLIEEYFDAPQYSVETLSVNGEHKIIAITKMGFSGPPDFVETEHHLPAQLDANTEETILNYTLKALDAFDIQVGASHIEIRISDDGVIKMIEIASRMGGWRHWMTLAALGVDYCQAIFDSTIGLPTVTTRVILNKKAIVRTISTTKDLELYYKEKQSRTNFVVDMVKETPIMNSVTNLMNTNGLYIFTKEI